MIIFHEGLPRSGKSYEACVKFILPALKNGRRVVTNIDGINYQQFSELSGQPIDWVKQNLIGIYTPDLDEQKRLILESAGKDSLICIDEIQNHFPSGREKLSPEWNVFISEHGHHGLDILLMGQDRRDCHTMWRRRIQRVISFTKLTAVGAQNSYRWEAYEAQQPEKFKKINSGTSKYDAKYFGLYKSHAAGTDNKDNLLDDRANIFKTSGFKYGLPAFLGVLYFAVSSLISFFSPESVAVVHEELPAQVAQPVAPQEPEKVEEKEEEQKPSVDIFDHYANNFRPRLAGYLHSPEKEIYFGLVEVRDDKHTLRDKFTFSGLYELGWSITFHSYGIELSKDGIVHVVTAWPLEHKLRGYSPPRNQLADTRRTAKRSTGPKVAVIRNNHYPLGLNDAVVR